MPEPKGELRTPVGFRSDGLIRAIELTDDDEVKVYINSSVLDDALTALQNLEALLDALDSVGLDEIDVNVEDSVLPTGAATSAAQATLLSELQAKLETADLEIVTLIPSVGSHGWIGGAWQRQSMLMGYSGDATEYFSGTIPAVLYGSFQSSAVPAGEIRNVQAIHSRNISGAGSTIQISCVVNGYSIILARETGLAQYATVRWQGSLIMSEGDKIQIDYSSGSEGDTIEALYHSIRVDIDQ